MGSELTDSLNDRLSSDEEFQVGYRTDLSESFSNSDLERAESFGGESELESRRYLEAALICVENTENIVESLRQDLKLVEELRLSGRYDINRYALEKNSRLLKSLLRKEYSLLNDLKNICNKLPRLDLLGDFELSLFYTNCLAQKY